MSIGWGSMTRKDVLNGKKDICCSCSLLFLITESLQLGVQIKDERTQLSYSLTSFVSVGINIWMNPCLLFPRKEKWTQVVYLAVLFPLLFWSWELNSSWEFCLLRRWEKAYGEGLIEWVVHLCPNATIRVFYLGSDFSCRAFETEF